MSSNDFWILIQKSKNRPKGDLFHFIKIKEISEIVTESCYSVGFYNPPRRTKHFWRKSNILAFDIDDDQALTMKSLQQKLKDIKYIVAPSKSHQEVKGNKPPCDRYRLLVFLTDYIYDYNLYKRYSQKFAEKYGFTPDKRSMDATHLFFPSKYIEYINEVGNCFDINTLELEEKNEEKIKVKEKSIPHPQDLYLLSKTSIPQKLQAFIDSNTTRPMRAKCERFIRMLMAQTNLVGKDPNTDEFIGQGRNPLPQQTIADFIPTTRVTLSKWFKYLLENDLLLDLDPHNRGGDRAKTYKALNELKIAIIKSYYENKASKPDRPLPREIEDGEWNKVLFEVAFRFQNDEKPDRYFNWAKSLRGFRDKPERELQMKNSWKNMKKIVKNEVVSS